MAGQLQGRTAFVTGGGRSMGRQIALRLARDGAQVCVVSRTAEQVEKTAADIIAAGGKAIGFASDIGVAGAAAEAVARAEKALGPIDILVNNAHNTAFFAMTGLIADIPLAQVQDQMDSGPFAALALMQACFPAMKARGHGRVINMASAAGTRGMAGFAPYAMSKEAMRALTRCAAREWGQYGITVNAICPAAANETVKTDAEVQGLKDILKLNSAAYGPIARPGSSEEDIAPFVSFLAGPEAGFLTGYTYWLDGGSGIDCSR